MRDSNVFKNILIAFFASAFIYAIITYLWLFGFLAGFLSRISYLKNAGNLLEILISANITNLLTYSILVLFFAVGTLVLIIKNNSRDSRRGINSCGVLNFSGESGGIIKILLYSLIFLYLFLLIIVDSSLVWVILILVVLLSSRVFSDRENFHKNYPSLLKVYLIFIICSIFFLNIRTKNIINSLQNSLAFKNEFITAFLSNASLLENGRNNLGIIDSLNAMRDKFKKNWFIGSGQATFAYNDSKFTNFDNETPEYRNKQPSNYLISLLSNTGILGFLSYIGLLIIFSIILSRITGSNIIKFIFCALAIIFSLQLLFVPNIYINFCLWLLLALVMIEAKKYFSDFFPELSSEKERNKTNGAINFYPIFNIFFIAGIIILIGIFIKLQRYGMAERSYKNYLILERARAREELSEAARLNPSEEKYHIALANDCLNEINRELMKSESERDLRIIADESAKSISIVKENIEYHPNSAIAWRTSGDVYKNVAPIVREGAEGWIIKSYEKALELDPANYEYMLELGKAYFSEGTANGFDYGKLEKAVDYYNNALRHCERYKCMEYNEIKVYLAKTLEANGQNKEAIDELENSSDARLLDENDPKILFELGRMYYNNNDLEKAEMVLNKILGINKNYSNALYVLSAIYEKKGDFNRALLLLKKVFELNPDNEDVLEKIKQMEKLEIRN